MKTEATVLDRLIANIDAVAEARGRRLTLCATEGVPRSAMQAVLMSGSVRRIVPPGEVADYLLAWWEPGTSLRTVGFLCRSAGILFDPKTAAPLEVKMRALESWVGVQAHVLPLDGDQALSEGLVTAGNDLAAEIPRFSCSMPVNMEENDVERVLASFLPIAWEWVVGVDAKSTDRTLEIVERYADVVFRFNIDPWSFAAARNETLARCSAPWIFQTEGHEHLHPDSVFALRAVGRLELPMGVVMVERDTGGGNPNGGETFFFPWIFRNHPTLRFSDTGGVHNALEMEPFAEAMKAPEGVAMRFRDFLRTIHKAHPVNRGLRDKQREDMNRKALEGYVDAGGARSPRALFYAAQEHASAGDLRSATRAAVRYIRTGDAFREQMYEAHVRLGEFLVMLKHPRLAIPILRRALPYDTNRIEADVVLADALKMAGDLEAARQCYAKAAGVMPPTYANLFIRKTYYRSLPWRGLAATCFELGQYGDAIRAARCALHFDPSDEVALKVQDALARYGEPVDSVG